ncbi:MAG: hypothetical protein PF518_17935 [Spirochaetaceae bacterium]|jgi:predicted Fe-Mo cluster-binding NifX family protein|nr:hypothetical protein [Spirochaetaceae bacterium]
MIIALCSSGKELTSNVDDRFGRASFFHFFNTENSELTVIENNAKDAKGGAGALAVQQLVDHKAEVLIAPELGPQAMEALNKFTIPAFKQGNVKTVNDAITAKKNNELPLIKKAENQGLHKV